MRRWITRAKAKHFPPPTFISVAGQLHAHHYGYKGRASNIDIDGTTCSTTKIMAADPRRVAEIVINFKFPKEYTEKEQQLLERSALTCPVYYSLNEDLKKAVTFGWEVNGEKRRGR